MQDAKKSCGKETDSVYYAYLKFIFTATLFSKIPIDIPWK